MNYENIKKRYNSLLTMMEQAQKENPENYRGDYFLHAVWLEAINELVATLRTKVV